MFTAQTGGTRAARQAISEARMITRWFKWPTRMRLLMRNGRASVYQLKRNGNLPRAEV